MTPVDEIVKEFLIESYENLDRLDQDLMALEEVPDDRNRLSSVFRAIHTIKGTSGFLAFDKLGYITHVGESLLVLLRDGKMRLNGPIANGLLALIDAVRAILANIEAGRGEGDADYQELVATLERLQMTGGVETATSLLEPDAARRASEVLDEIAQQVGIVAKMDDTSKTNAGATAPAKKRSKGAGRRKKVANSKTLSETSSPVMEMSFPLPVSPLGKIPGERSGVELSFATSVREFANQDVQNVLPKRLDPGVVAGRGNVTELDGVDKGNPPSISDSTVRIEVTLLDKLMNLVGELVLTRNQILQCSRSTEDASLNAAAQRLNLITAELQEGVMKTRMQPIQNAWAKLPRIVRDLAVTCGKNVQLTMEGAETELDKTILEAIRDPLTHIVRNSVDHGIETPEVRLARGKPVEGTLMLRAFHESGQVYMEVSDDGGGIDLARVKMKAIRHGLITADQAAAMSDRELTNLILLPGFSTAEIVTSISGRGVGLDVVKNNVEKIGGTLDIQSVYGQGTTLRIKIPLTLAIIPALMVGCGEDRYAIPQKNLVELVRLEGERVRREIENIHHAPVYRLRGELLPLLYLDEQLQLRSTRSAADFHEDSVVNIVVLSADDRSFGLVVDAIYDTEEIVVKPLGPHLKDVASYAGVTIMGDGTVALILDTLGVARNAKVTSESQDQRAAPVTANEMHASKDHQTLLLLGLGDEQRLAIPLSLVTRLEEIPIGSIELSHGQQVVQYAGQIMPLIDLGQALRPGHTNPISRQTLPVVVYSENGRFVGLIVDRILDIVETSLTIHRTVRRAGLLGSAVIQNRVTDLLDVHNLILANDQDFYAPQSTVMAV